MRRSRRTPAARRQRGLASEPGGALVALVARLVLAQAGLATVIGFCYSRRHGPGIVITLMLAVALCGLAAVVRTGGHLAWVAALGFEAAFSVTGLLKFVTAYFLGGTLFGLLTLAALLHPAVARAFGVASGPDSGELRDGRFGGTADPVSDPLGG